MKRLELPLAQLVLFGASLLATVGLYANGRQTISSGGSHTLIAQGLIPRSLLRF